MNHPLLYSKHNDNPRREIGCILDNYLKLIKWRSDGGDSVLDVGCGPGNVTMDILLPRCPPNFQRLLGVDLSKEMVNFAKSQNDNEKVDFAIMDISSKTLQLQDYGQFDHVFSFFCLHWIQDQRQMFKNIYDLLKPGGDFLVAYVASNPIFSVYENMSLSNKWMEYTKDFSSRISPYHKCKDPIGIIENILEKVGFTTHVCKVVKNEFVFRDLQYFKNFIISVNPFLSKIPGRLHNDYIDDFVEEVRSMNLIDECTDGDNNKAKIILPTTIIVIVASKPE